MEDKEEIKVVSRKFGEKPETRIVHRDFRVNPTMEEIKQDITDFYTNTEKFSAKIMNKAMSSIKKHENFNLVDKISLEIDLMNNHIKNLIKTFESLLLIASTTRGDYEKIKTSLSMAIDCMQKQLISNIKELGIAETDTFGV